MKSKVIFLSFICFHFMGLKAQDTFIPYGKIRFEKKVNMIRSMENSGLPDEAKEKMKKYAASNWELFFDRNKSLYKAEKKENENERISFLPFSLNEQSNEIYTDYSKKQRVLKRNIIDEDYLFSDTIPKLNWKIIPEIRTIAGHECRKAIGVIFDTVYVVAFYTDDILLRGGPEGFGGLPGMILGLAIPRYNTTWFATKVEGFADHRTEIVAPGVGKKIETEKDLKKIIELFTRYESDKKEKAEEAKKRLYGFTL